MRVILNHDRAVLIHGDSETALATLADCSVDAVITDPPAGIAFMGKSWDKDKGGRDLWTAWLERIARECYRVLKPGGHLIAWALPRTSHWTARATEDAGFENRDIIHELLSSDELAGLFLESLSPDQLHALARLADSQTAGPLLYMLFGTGFPKSLDVAKAIDASDRTEKSRARALTFTAWMRSTGITASAINTATGTNMGSHYLTAAEQPAVATADLFDLLRPLLPAVPAEIEELVRERTVESENSKRRPVVGVATMADARAVRPGFAGEAYGGETGARREVAITEAYTDAARQWEGWGTALKPAVEHWILARKPLAGTVATNVLAYGTGGLNVDACRVDAGVAATDEGRWPAHLTLAHSDACAAGACVLGCAVREFDKQAGERKSAAPPAAKRAIAKSGGASRFYYCAKPSRAEKEAGLDHLPKRSGGEATGRSDGTAGLKSPRAGAGRNGGRANIHPTVKSIALMRWLVQLVTPPGGVVLDPFAGSGTTGIAALELGCRFVGIEQGGPCRICQKPLEHPDHATAHAYDPEYLPILEGRIRHALGE